MLTIVMKGELEPGVILCVNFSKLRLIKCRNTPCL